MDIIKLYKINKILKAISSNIEEDITATIDLKKNIVHGTNGKLGISNFDETIKGLFSILWFKGFRMYYSEVIYFTFNSNMSFIDMIKMLRVIKEHTLKKREG